MRGCASFRHQSPTVTGPRGRSQAEWRIAQTLAIWARKQHQWPCEDEFEHPENAQALFTCAVSPAKTAWPWKANSCDESRLRSEAFSSLFLLNIIHFYLGGISCGIVSCQRAPTSRRHGGAAPLPSLNHMAGREFAAAGTAVIALLQVPGHSSSF